MAAFTQINDFVEHVAEKVHNLGADALTYALSNTLPSAETLDPTTDGNGVIANVTQISYTNLPTSRVPAISASAQTGGVYKLTLADVTLVATGAVATFRYIYLYNATAASGQIIGYYDHGSAVTMANLEEYLIDNDVTNGVLTIS